MQKTILKMRDAGDVSSTTFIRVEIGNRNGEMEKYLLGPVP